MTDNVAWEDVNIGLGEEWDFDSSRDGNPMIARYVASIVTTVPDRSGDDRETYVHQFSPTEEPDRLVFLWGSYQLDEAFTPATDGTSIVHAGDLVRITYLGKREIKDGAQSMRSYRIQLAKIS